MLLMTLVNSTGCLDGSEVVAVFALKTTAKREMKLESHHEQTSFESVINIRIDQYSLINSAYPTSMVIYNSN